MRRLLEFLGLLANLGLGLACLALAGLAWLDGADLLLPLLPVAPENAAAAAASVGLVGVVSSLLATSPGRWARVPMFLWSLGLLALLKAAVFRSSYRFDGIEGFVEHALLVIGASVLVVLTFLRLRSAGRPNPLAHITRSGRLYPR